MELAVQIAAGVEAAHEAGVIHRDLKPANIIVTPDGKAKVLDFGLARTDEGGQSSTGALDSPTMTTPHPQHSPTIEGTILGTAAYMSPEQARGRRVDKRTDIWSFGVVLYEMLTGASPFVGETVTDSIGAVLHKDLDLDRLPAGTPVTVRRVLKRCLERDKNLRFRDIGDVRVELLRVDEEAIRESAPARSLPIWFIPVALVALIAVAAVVWVVKPVPKPPPPPVVQADIALPGDLKLAHSFMPGIAISADGRTLAFAAGDPYTEGQFSILSSLFSGDLYIRRLDEPDAVPVAGAEDVGQPAFSPDGSRVAYVKRDDAFTGRIETISITGGRATPLTEGSIGITGLDWSDDGRIVFGTVEGLRSIPEAGGPITKLTTFSQGQEFIHAFPDVLPGGDGILYTVPMDSRKPAEMIVRVLDTSSGESRELLTNASNTRYTRGHLIFARDHTIHAVPFDLETMTLSGESRPLGMSVIQSHEAPNGYFINSAAQFAVSESGDLVYAQGSIWPELPLPTAWVNRDGVAEVIKHEPGKFLAPRVDAAGERLLLSSYYDSSIWIHDIARGVTSRVRREGGSAIAWGPGPDDLTFHDREGELPRIGWVTLGDTAEPFTLDPPPGVDYLFVDGWSPDRRHLLCIGGDYINNFDMVVWSEGDGWVYLTETPALYEISPTVSPDGRWIAYTEREVTGESRVFVRPFLRDGPAIQVSTTNSVDPLWSPDGAELYYRSLVDAPAENLGATRFGSVVTQDWVTAAPVTYSDDGIDIGRPQRLFRADDYARIFPLRSWDIGPDGRFLMAKKASEEHIRAAINAFFPTRVRLIQNWASTLEGERP